MKRLLACIAVLLSTGGIQSAAALEHFTSGRFAGVAPITVDGDFSDWDSFSIIPLPISQINSLSQTGLPRNTADLSASFRCLADDKNIYIAVSVQDDILTFGEEQTGIPFLDDCVEVLLYPAQTGLSPAKIWISRDKNGEVRLEGREPVGDTSYPFVWSNQGVCAALTSSDTGYRVELMIPGGVLNLVGWTSGDLLRMNATVYDDDNGGSFESILQWAGPAVPGYNTIGFSEILVPSDIPAVSGAAVQELVIELESAVQTEAAVDPAVQYDLGLAFERAGMYAEAIAELRKTDGGVSEGELKNKIQLTLARNYFFTGEYDKAKPICEELLRVETDSKRILDANMILLSVDRNRSGFMDQ